MIFVILILSAFFALNMGSASFAASFAASHGGKVLDKKTSVMLFMFFVALGAIVLGQRVSVTLGRGLINSDLINEKAIVIILLTAGVSMFMANLINIPQSTSLVTVAAISGVGFFYHKLNYQMLLFFIPFWILLPVLSYFLTYRIARYIYPPRNSNFWVYERIINHERKLKIFIVLTSCYNAFSVGTNNVANVVGPVLNLDFSQNVFALLLGFGLVYGSGSILFSKTLTAVSKQIVPLGLMTASIIAFVSGSLMITASYFGVPQSFVMLQMGAIFAVMSIKEGKETAFGHPIFKKVLYTWTINPVITFFISFMASRIFLK